MFSLIFYSNMVPAAFYFCRNLSKIPAGQFLNFCLLLKLLFLSLTKNLVAEFSRELEKSIRCYPDVEFLQPAAELERLMTEDFTSSVTKGRRWREGHAKSSFTYLLLDPRTSRNLPVRSPNLSPSEQWLDFLSSVFYVGKGLRSRPYAHLYKAVGFWSGRSSGPRSANVERILNIWAGDEGVICLHLFHSTIPVEAYTREAAMIDAIGWSSFIFI
jgi:ankyrin repeat and LEM domain-containing protein 1